MYTNDRNDICHDRVCCPTQPPAGGGIPREYRVPKTRTLCIIRVLGNTPYDMRRCHYTEKCNVFIHSLKNNARV